MRKFQFRLQSALDLRRRREENLRAELGRMQQRRQEELRRLEALLEEREEAMRSAAAGRVGRISPEESRTQERHLEALEHSLEAQRQALELVQREIDRKVAEVVVATQETRALENLHDRHLEEHRREAQRDEQKFLDDLASIRAARGGATA